MGGRASSGACVAARGGRRRPGAAAVRAVGLTQNHVCAPGSVDTFVEMVWRQFGQTHMAGASREKPPKCCGCCVSMTTISCCTGWPITTCGCCG